MAAIEPIGEGISKRGEIICRPLGARRRRARLRHRGTCAATDAGIAGNASFGGASPATGAGNGIAAIDCATHPPGRRAAQLSPTQAVVSKPSAADGVVL